MAAKEKVPSCGCSIVCSKVRSNFRWFLNLKWREKVLQGVSLEAGKNFFCELWESVFFLSLFHELANYVSKQMRKMRKDPVEMQIYRLGREIFVP